MPKKIKASIIILTHNNLEYTRQCIESVFAKTTHPEFEVIVVDNGSQDATPQYLTSLAATQTQLKIILNEHNEGFSRGNNIGAAEASGEFLVFLNNDTIVTRGWLDGLIKHLKNPTVGMVGPVTNASGNQTRIPVDYANLEDMDSFADDHTKAHAGQAFEIDMLPFLCVALRRDVFDEIGPLDERFGLGMFEDDDYAMRLKEKGYKILCAEDVFVHHFGSVSISNLGVQQYWETFIQNRKTFESKWQTNWQPHSYRIELIRQQLDDILNGLIGLVEQNQHQNKTINQYEEVIKEQEENNQKIWSLLAARDEKINSLHDMISERDQQLNQIFLQVQERDEKINSLFHQVSEHLNRLEESTDLIRVQEQKLQAAEHQIDEYTQRMHEYWKHIIDRDYIIQEIYRSRAWKIVQFLWTVRLWFIPKNSLRENLIQWLQKAFQIWNQDGILILIGKTIQKLVPSSLKSFSGRIVIRLAPKKIQQFIKNYRESYPIIDRSTVVLFADPSILPHYPNRHDLSPMELDKKLIKVTLISTVLNEAAGGIDWLKSLLEQSRLPDEIIITDGGSTDNTVQLLKEFSRNYPVDIQVVEAPGTNISQGRNIAIRNATHPIIACTDFGCVLDTNWLQDLVYPFECDSDVSVSAGNYQATESDDISKVCGSFFVKPTNHINPQEFLPSSRSVAFKKSVWFEAGGYPEWLSDAGEDTLFDVQIKTQSIKWAFVPGAVVSWKPPTSFRKMWKIFERYAKGDGESGLFASNYLLKTELVILNVALALLFIITTFLSILWNLQWIYLLFAGLFLIAIIQNCRKTRQASLRLNVGFKFATLHTLYMAVINYAQVIGYSKGVANRPRVHQRKVINYRNQLQGLFANHPDHKGIIIYPPTHDWGFMFQRPHQMARAFSTIGYLFFYCTNNERTDSVFGFKEVEPRLFVCHVPLQVFSELESPILYIGSAWHRDAIQDFKNPLVIYDHYDDIKVSSARQEDHQVLIEKSNIVLVTSRELQTAIDQQRPDAVFAPNAVDYVKIIQNKPTDHEKPPEDMIKFIQGGKPIIGYSGALAEWFDYDLLAHAARCKPEYEFVLIGVNYDGSLDRSQILENKNVHWLGLKPYNQLFKYIWRFDVGLIPFKINEITLATSPIKLFEYMACELPPVTTALPECKAYPGVFISESPNQFTKSIDSALLMKNDHNYQAIISRVAMKNTWINRANLINIQLEKLFTGFAEPK